MPQHLVKALACLCGQAGLRAPGSCCSDPLTVWVLQHVQVCLAMLNVCANEDRHGCMSPPPPAAGALLHWRSIDNPLLHQAQVCLTLAEFCGDVAGKFI
jgi:hypothetical protein